MKNHEIIVAGWDIVNGGWIIECSCGFCTPADVFMEAVGEQFDNHLREAGVLVES